MKDTATKTQNSVKSMTAFSRATVPVENGEINIEIKSVNHKFLDLNIKSNLSFSGAQEIEIRKLLSTKLSRGKVDLLIFKRTSASSQQVEDQFAGVNKLFYELIHNYKKFKGKYSQDLIGISETVCTELFTLAVRQTQSSIYSNNELTDPEYTSLFSSVNICLAQMIEMRIQEGSSLALEISNEIKTLYDLTQRVEKHAQSQPTQILNRLKTRINDLKLELVNVDQDKLIQETAFLVQKADFSEELTRIKSHLSQTQELLANEATSACGKKLDFLAQELNREVNTMLAKCGNSDITTIGIEMRLCIEKIREQSQNLE